MPTALAPDTPELRKARGAFFTPEPVTQFMCDWAIRDPGAVVLEPSAGDAAFLVAAARRLRGLGAETPTVHGVELHEESASKARNRVQEVGGNPEIATGDFFLHEPIARHDAIIGNPPYIRYQDFGGEPRARSRQAALRAGVALTALASSWAAFAVHSALFLRPGGRLALVLPAELLSVNYASPVRRFLFDRFRHIELVLFEEQIFPDAEADVLLLLADGYQHGPTDQATIRHVKNADALNDLPPSTQFTPDDPAAKWTSLLTDSKATEALAHAKVDGALTGLEQWGDTTLGMVTGNNGYFTLSPRQAREAGLTRRDLTRISPPGSAHLRGLQLTTADLTQLGRRGHATWLFSPGDRPSPSAEAFIAQGERDEIHHAYKCRVRTPWYRVPLLQPADLLLTCMNADTPRLSTNSAKVLHLNSVHGVYLNADHRELGRELLPLASLNSFTLLSAELVGRSYGGGILKLEPREADIWAVPAPELVADKSVSLRKLRDHVARLLATGDLGGAVEIVDRTLFTDELADALRAVREAHNALRARRTARGRSGN